AQTIGKRAGDGLAYRLQVEEIDDFFHLAAMIEFLAPCAGQPVQRSRDEIIFQKMMPPDHDVVEYAHMMKQRQILKGAADAEPGPRVRIERGDVAATIKQLAFVDAKADIGERTHAAEAQ